MKLVQRYYLKEFLKAFSIISFGFSVMLASIELTDNLDILAYKTLPNLIIYLLNTIPQFLVYTMPMAALFGSLFVVGQSMRTKEAIAVMAAGGRLRNLFMPLAITGAVLSVFNFAASEFIAPAGLRQARAMTVQTDKSAFYSKGTLWFRANDGSLVRFSLYSKMQGSAKGVSIFRLSGGSLSERLEAAEAFNRENQWILEDVKTYDLLQGKVWYQKELVLEDLVPNKVLEKEGLNPQEMALGELKEYSKRLEQAGIKNLKLSVDMNSRLSYPFVNFFMVLLGISLSLRSGLGGLASTSIGVGVSLLYWFSYTMALSIGYAGIFPPMIAAWLVPLVFAAASIWLFFRVRE